MKRRNGRWHKEKQIRRLQEKRDDLSSSRLEVEYVPLENPVFAGWEVNLYVEGQRKDKPELEEILEQFNWNNSIFIKNKNYIRMIRVFKHSYNVYASLMHHYGGIKQFLYQKQYDELSIRAKEYFFEVTKLGYGNSEYKLFYLKWGFPNYAIKVKINKSYHYFRAIPNSQDESDYKKLDNWLYMYDIKTWGRYRYRYDFRKANKVAMQNALKKIVKKQYSPDEIIDYHDEIFRDTCQRRDFGWS